MKTLAIKFIALQGTPQAAADWLTDQTGRTYTSLRVMGFRTRGVPQNIRPLVMEYVMIRILCSECVDQGQHFM